MTAWTDLVTKVYNENKSKPGYKLKNAMKDAAKIYKPSAAAAPGKTKKGRKGSRKQTKKRRSRK